MQKINTAHAIKTLLASEGWKILCNWIDEEIALKEKNIFSVAGEHNEVKYTAKDTFILERKYLLEIKEAPMAILAAENIGLDSIPSMEEILADQSKLSNMMPEL